MLFRRERQRDYELNAWRNTRRNLANGTWRESVTNVVVDTVATMRPAGANAFRPLSIAYVDERRELFAFAPERDAFFFAVIEFSTWKAMSTALPRR